MSHIGFLVGYLEGLFFSVILLTLVLWPALRKAEKRGYDRGFKEGVRCGDMDSAAFLNRQKADEIRGRHAEIFKKQNISPALKAAMDKISQPGAWRKQFKRDNGDES